MTAQNTTGRGIVNLDARAVEATVGLVKRAGLADFGRPTPCAGWSLAGLIGPAGPDRRDAGPQSLLAPLR